MRRKLDYQADRLEALLSFHKVNGRILGGTVTPRLIRFHLLPALGTRVAQVAHLSEELALALGARSCRVFRHGPHIELEFPRDDPQPLRLLSLAGRLPAVPACSAILGLDPAGTPLVLRLPSPDVAHVLISGTTGCGKTALARTMIASLVLHNPMGQVALVLMDPKGRGYRPFVGLPHLARPLAGDPHAALEALLWLESQMERREREGIQRPWLVAFVDELSDLLLVAGKEVERALTRLVQRGRETGVHVVACTQKPTAGLVGTLAKANFPTRLVGSVSSAEDARVAAGIAGTGAEKLAGRGDFVLVVKGETVRLQAAYLTEEDLEEVVSRVGAVIPPRGRGDRRLVSGPGEPGMARGESRRLRVVR